MTDILSMELLKQQRDRRMKRLEKLKGEGAPKEEILGTEKLLRLTEIRIERLERSAAQ